MNTTAGLKKTLSGFHLWGIAVGLVISGEYFGWSYGWASAGTLGFLVTAVFITVDEAGGYYDSGYIQPVGFFGDGPRIPLIVVSPLTRGGRVSHEYGDHVSILKFIEANWGLPTDERGSLRGRRGSPSGTNRTRRAMISCRGDLIFCWPF